MIERDGDGDLLIVIRGRRREGMKSLKLALKV
jgi:hypothetical protein